MFIFNQIYACDALLHCIISSKMRKGGMKLKKSVQEMNGYSKSKNKISLCTNWRLLMWTKKI